MGAVILPLMALYLGLLIWATWYGWRWAKRRNYSTGKRVLCAIGGFLIVYLPLMWDWIPTELAHRYYCKKESGLWIYKTLDQWKAENPDVFETLVYDKNIPFKWVYDNGDKGKKTIDFLNKRVGVSFERKRVISFFILEKYILEIIDLKDGEVLARHVDFNYNGGKPALGTGYRFWMEAAYCPNGLILEKRFFEFKRLFEGARK